VLSGRLGVGFEYDTNRNYSTSSGQSLFFDFPLNNTPPQSDTNMIYTGNLEIHHDLGMQAGHEVFGSFTYYRTEQTQIHLLNLQIYSLQGGGVYKSPYFHLTPTAIYDYVLLDQSLYYRDHGGNLKLDHNITPKWNIYVQGQDVYQDFTPTDSIPFASDRGGIQIDGTAGTDLVLNPAMKLGLSYTYSTKHANNPIWAFHRNSGTLSHTWLLGKGMFLYSTLTVSYDAYPTPDQTVSVIYRHDNTWHGMTSFGLPLSVFGDLSKSGSMTNALRDFVWVFTYDYYQAVSTIPNYAYTNNKFSTLLTYKWNVGW
jgi:hypothetical protein